MAVSASMQFEYGISSQKATTFSTGAVTDTDSTTFSQLYNLGFERLIYPNLEIHAGGSFEKDFIKSRTDGSSETTGTDETLRPYAGVSLNASPFVLGLNYIENRITSGFTGSPTSTIVQDNYTANFSWMPYALPPVSFSYAKYHTFDPAHRQANIVNDNFSYSTMYHLLPNLRVSYSGSYSESRDLLNLVTNNVSSNGILASFATVWGEQTGLNVSYGASTMRQTAETTVQSGGLVYFRVIPFDSFSRGPDTIPPAALQFQLNPNDTTYENRALIDGDVKSVAAGNNGSVNIGTAGNPIPNIPQYFHMGIEFQNNPVSNALFVYVSQDISNIANFNPATAFSWSVYTSNDGRMWTPVVLSAPAAFKTIDPLGMPATGFEIDLPADINAAWVQVTVSPLSSLNIGNLLPSEQKQLGNIFVTELRAFDRKPAQQVQSATETTSSQYMSFGFHTLVWQYPAVAFNLSYVANSQGMSRFSFLGSGGLTLNQSFRLSRTLTGTASFYTQESAGQTTGNVVRHANSGISLVYTAGLTWIPIPAFKSNMLYSGTTYFTKGSSQMNSVFLDNTAQLYPGISVYLNGGGDSLGNYLYSAGAGFTPYRTMTIGLNYSGNVTAGYSTQNDGASIAFSPFSNLFLGVSANRVSNSLTSMTALDYNVGWSPLQGGILQLGLRYDESLGYGPDMGKTRTIGADADLRLTPSAFLDVVYSIQKSESSISQTNSNNIFLQFRKMM